MGECYSQCDQMLNLGGLVLVFSAYIPKATPTEKSLLTCEKCGSALCWYEYPRPMFHGPESSLRECGAPSAEIPSASLQEKAV